MHARMVRQKLFHLAAAVGRMLIPHYHNRSRNVMQQMCEKSNHLLPADRVTIGLQIQLDLAFPWTHAQGANQVQALIVFKTRANGRSLPTRRPTPFEWRNQRKPAFIEENEGCAEFTPLFLPVARHSVSNGRSRHRLAPDSAVVAFGNSNRFVARDTKHCSHDTVRETGSRSNERSDPASSNLLHSHTHKPHASRRTLNAVVERRINGWDAPALAHSACVCGVGTGNAIGTHSGVSHPRAWQLPWDLVRVVTIPRHADVGVPVVQMFRRVSCAHYRI